MKYPLHKEWVNRRSEGPDTFTALHYASFRGNLEMIKLLLDAGANQWAVNEQGINMIHVGA